MSKLITVYPIDVEFLNEDKYLRQLTIRCNLSSLMKIPDLSNLSELVYFYLERNHITSLEGIEVLNSLEKLEELHLAGNKITSLKGFENLVNCKNLRKIDLSFNKITDLGEFSPLSHFPKLEEIDLTCNSITDVNITHDVPNLLKLEIPNNNIKHITAIKNLSKLKTIDFSNYTISSASEYYISKVFDFDSIAQEEILDSDQNNYNHLTKLENLSNLPSLEVINIYNNLVDSFDGLEKVPSLNEIKYFYKFRLPDDFQNTWKPYFKNLGFKFYWLYHDTLYIKKREHPALIFKINEFISLKLKDLGETMIQVNGRNFMICKYLVFDVPLSQTETYNDYSSIDEVIEKIDKSEQYEDIELPPETAFWGHCSNLQVWCEMGYNSRILTESLAFPLLRRLTDVGDLQARKVFKEEIGKRYNSGDPKAKEYLKKRGYLNYLTEDERKSLA